MNNIAPELDEIADFALDTDRTVAVGGESSGAKDYARRFDIVDATDMHDDPVLLAAWQEMLGRGAGPEKLYQTPEFFRYALETEQGSSKSPMLYVVRRNSDGAYVGVVPVRRSEQHLAFGLGPVKLFVRKVTTLQVMGSVPLLDRDERKLAGFVFDQLLRRHPDCQVLSMQAVPAEQVSALDTLSGLSAYVHNGLRDCHTVPLPENFNAYLQKFSSKKRYNLSRQVRLLGEQAGEVQVCRIEEPAQVPGLIEAMRTVLTPQQFARSPRQARLERMAKYGILHSYVIRCSTEDVAFVFASRSADVWHVHQIVASPKYQGVSAGTSAAHLALQDVITHFSFADADFGYGTPNQEFRSTHVLKPRATVLVCRSRNPTALLLAVHGLYQRATGALVASVKEGQRRLKQRKRAAAAAAAKQPAAN